MFAVESDSGVGDFSLFFSSSGNVGGRDGPDPTVNRHKCNLV